MLLVGGVRAGLQISSIATGLLDPTDEQNILITAAAYGGSDSRFSDLAYPRYSSNDLDDAILRYRAAAQADPRDPNHAVDLAFALTKAGRCDEAVLALAEAQRRNREATGKWNDPGLTRVRWSLANRDVQNCQLHDPACSAPARGR